MKTMKTTSAWASTALLASLAIATPTGTGVVSPSATTTEASSCTASLVAELCNYPEPKDGDGFAVAASGPDTCWDYCAKNAPCGFFIFLALNPNTGAGTCWMYPGETYDPSLASSTGCDNKYMKVYDSVTCTDPAVGAPTPIGTNTASVPACAATASPSPIAKVCGYPAPPDGCFDSCSAQSGSSGCLDQCAQSDSCAFAIFKPGNEELNPYYSGTCWMYPEGSVYDPKLAGTCDGKPEQYVYENKCLKPAKPSPSSVGGQSAGASPTSGTGAGASQAADLAAAAAASTKASTPEKGAASVLASASAGSLSVGVVALLWQAFM